MPTDGSTREGMRALVEAALAAAVAHSQVPFVTIRRAMTRGDVDGSSGAGGRIVGSSRYLALAPSDLRLEIGWTWLEPAVQRTAVNTEAKLLMLAHAFEDLGCRRVELKTDALNEPSRTAILGIGATFEGVFRKHMIMSGGRARDSAYYSIVDDEWPSVRARLEARLERHRAAAGHG